MGLCRLTLHSKNDLTSDVYLNVFHYELPGPTSPTITEMSNLMTSFLASVLPPLRAIMTTEYEYTRLDAIGLLGVAEVSQTIATGSGTEAVNSLPPFVTVGFKYQRATASTRNGYKRFSGVPEIYVSPAGIITSATYDTNLATAANALEGSHTTVDGTWAPVILRIERNPATGVTTYTPNGVSGVIPPSVVGSQVTRKTGRGQ